MMCPLQAGKGGPRASLWAMRRMPRAGWLLGRLLLLLLLPWCTGARGSETIGPIIGILRQPSSSSNPACGGKCEYIAGSYVKWVESAGGRVVPIPYNASTEVLDVLFDGINGILLPGGGGSPVSHGIDYIVQRALDANRQGDFFPVWATCLGWEWLAQILSGPDFRLDGGLDSENLSLPLDFITPHLNQSRLFAGASPELLLVLSHEPVTFNNHHKGVTIDKFQSTPELSDMFSLLSVNKDRLGRPFVSTLEAQKGMPLYAVQWHPEKNVFEWGKGKDGSAYEDIPHSPQAMAVADYFSRFFVAEARKCTHTFSDPAIEAKELIYNYSPVYSGPEYVTSYYF